MRFTHEMDYPADPQVVFAMLTDPAFREAVCDHQQVLRYDVSVSRTETDVTIDVDQVQPATGIPSFAAKFVGEEIEVEQRERWTSETTADLHISIPGKPGQMSGAIILTPTATGTRETIDGEIKVSIPFIGSKLEALVGDIFRLGLDAENTVGQRWLTDGA